MPSDYGHGPHGGGYKPPSSDRGRERDLYAYGPGEDPYGHDAYSEQDQYLELDDEPDEGGAGRRLLKAGVALAGVLVLGGVVGYAYNWGTQGGPGGEGELPVVEVEDRPEKVRPEDPGGMEIPHQDALVLNQRGSDDGEPRMERLLPPPETPEALPESADIAQVEEEGARSTESRQDSADDGASRIAERPELETPETPRPPGTEDGGSAGAAEPEPEAAPEQESASADPEPEPEPEPTPEVVEESGAPEPEAEEQDAVAALPPAEGGFAIQLAAVSEQARAREEWDRLQQVYPDVLGGMELNLQPTEVQGQGTLWRIRTQPFGDRAAAESACERLEAADQSCLVVAP